MQMIGWILLMIVFFLYFWFPSLVIGRKIVGKNLSQPQKDRHFVAAMFAAILFTLALAVTYYMIHVSILYK